MKTLIKLLLALCVITSCREDLLIENTVIDDPIPKTSYIYEFDIQGLVSDQDGNELEGVLLSIGTNEVLSDENGFFEFENIEGSPDGVYIHATRDGYVQGGELLIPANDLTQQVKIALKLKDPSFNFNNAEGAQLEFQNDAGASVPSGAFDVNGEVSVNAFHISPTNTNLEYISPSSSFGISREGEKKFVKIAGLLSVDFEDEGGNSIQPKEGTKIELRIPIAGNIGEWPETIPLWSLNTMTGYWEEQSSAVKVGNLYIGDVDHFSWWCAGDFGDLIDVCFKVVNNSSEPVAGLEVFNLTWQNGYIESGITDESGLYCTKLSDGEGNLIVVYNSCLEVLYNEIIALDEGQPELLITIDDTVEDVVFSGTISRCDGSELEDAYVTINIDGRKTLVELNNGSYEHTSYCELSTSSNVEILAVDRQDYSSQIANINIETGVVNYSRDVQLCESLDTYLSYKNVSDGTEVLFIDCKALKNPNETLIVAKSSESTNESLLLGIEGFQNGEFGTSMFGIQTEVAISSKLNTTITSYGEVDGFIIGTFTGVTEMGEEVEGDFKALRTK